LSDAQQDTINAALASSHGQSAIDGAVNSEA
jgi:hypothetical protein